MLGSDEAPGIVVRFIHGGSGEPIHREYLEVAGLADGAVDAAVARDGTVLVVWASVDVSAGATQVRAARVRCPDVWMRCNCEL